MKRLHAWIHVSFEIMCCDGGVPPGIWDHDFEKRAQGSDVNAPYVCEVVKLKSMHK